jgi:DNA-binding transcriptional LysR family regulator
MVGGNLKYATLPTTMSVIAAETTYIAAARLGLGLIHVPRYRLASELADGSLLKRLPDFLPSPSPVCVLYPQKRQRSSRVHVFIGWLVFDSLTCCCSPGNMARPKPESRAESVS